VLARSKRADAGLALALLFELPKQEKGAGTVTGEAQTRNINNDDVSIRHGRGMCSSSSSACATAAL